jgi:hypothetical protein
LWVRVDAALRDPDSPLKIALLHAKAEADEDATVTGLDEALANVIGGG